MKILFYLLLVIFLPGCSSHQLSIDEKKQGGIDSFQLPDSLFVFKDIQNSLIEDKFWYNETTHKYFPDSTVKTAFIYLDSDQMVKLILPVMILERKTDSASFVNHINYLYAFFVSKQKNIREFTPIIVKVLGDDYGTLVYIVLDKSLKPVSYFLMRGGDSPGPTETDSTIELPPVTNSFIKGNEILSYSIAEFIMKTDSIKRNSIFDSVNYMSEMLPSGHIVTKRVDSTRYERKSKWWRSQL